MARQLTSLDFLWLPEHIRSGKELLERARDAVRAHKDFKRWVHSVEGSLAMWPNGHEVVGHWHTLPESTLVRSGHYYNSDSDWHEFQTAVRARITWLAELLQRSGAPPPAPEQSHTRAKQKSATKDGPCRIFIGHGRSNVWRDLKDFIQDRLSLPWEEFNREPAAGKTTTERLVELVLSCGFAFIVLTADDVHADGSAHARENAIHEAGLFQGKLGFRKCIILLEDGCTEFSNIHGLSQIRFPKGQILVQSEEIRRVLERERVLQPVDTSNIEARRS